MGRPGLGGRGNFALWLVTSDAGTTQWPREAWIVLSGIMAGVGVVIMSLAAQLVLWAWISRVGWSAPSPTVGRRRTSCMWPLTPTLSRARQSPGAQGFPLRCGRVVVVVDIDDFKAINDVHSHAAGDDVLRDLASSLRAESRAGDALFRLGGDEFMLLLADLDLVDAQAWAVRLGLRIRHVASEVPPYSVTVGMSPCRGPVAAALVAADEALVAAKRDGLPLGIAPPGQLVIGAGRTVSPEAQRRSRTLVAALALTAGAFAVAAVVFWPTEPSHISSLILLGGLVPLGGLFLLVRSHLDLAVFGYGLVLWLIVVVNRPSTAT